MGYKTLPVGYRFSRAKTLVNVIAVVILLLFVYSILHPYLMSAASLNRTITCHVRHKAVYAGMFSYHSNHDDKFMAVWDKGDGSWSVMRRESSKAPYTYWYYILGEAPPAVAWDSETDNWWNIKTQSYGGFDPVNSPVDRGINPDYHCIELQKKMGKGDYVTQFQPGLLSLSLAVPYLYDSDTGLWKDDYSWYPEPDLFTHPSTTVLLSCLGGDSSDSEKNYSGYNGWTTFNTTKYSNPHEGESNYLFADGHVETLPASARTPVSRAPMWESSQGAPK